jgi:Family of unknown function (DUF6522)
MRLDPTDTGFAIAAADLAALLDLPAREVQALMRQGRITSRFERGEGADAGRFRVTFFHGPRRVQLTVDGEGQVLQRSRVVRNAPPVRSGRAP